MLLFYPLSPRFVIKYFVDMIKRIKNTMLCADLCHNEMKDGIWRSAMCGDKIFQEFQEMASTPGGYP